MQGFRPLIAATSALSSATIASAILFPSIRSMGKGEVASSGWSVESRKTARVPRVHAYSLGAAALLVTFVVLPQLQAFDLDQNVFAVWRRFGRAINDDHVIRVFLDLLGLKQLRDVEI